MWADLVRLRGNDMSYMEQINELMEQLTQGNAVDAATAGKKIA